MAVQYGRGLEIMTKLTRHVAPSTYDSDLKENHFRRTIRPQSFPALAFIFLELD